MTLSIPDTLNISNSEKYTLSIRLRSGGLSFSGYNPLDGNSFFFRKVTFERNNRSYEDNLKEFFFENEQITFPYKKINVIIVSPQYTLVPAKIYKDKPAEQFLNFNFSQPESRALSNPVFNNELEVVFGMNEIIYEFCCRSLLNPQFTHHISPLLSFWKKQCILKACCQMYVNLHEKMVDIVCFNGGKLLFANSFSFEQLNDILYYILYVWKQLDMDQLTDLLSISGNYDIKLRILALLRNYIQNITQTEVPSEVYLLGDEAVQAPIDLLTLLICE